MPTVYTLSRDSIEKLAADHERLSHMVKNLQARLNAVQHTPAAGVSLYPGKTTSDVTAFNSSTPGTGTAAIYTRRTDTNNLEAVGDEEQTVYNVGGLVESGNWCLFARDAWGDWWLVVVPCE